MTATLAPAPSAVRHTLRPAGALILAGTGVALLAALAVALLFPARPR